MIKLVAVDMDGTFLDHRMQYPRRLFAKIYQYFQEQGIRFVVASGNQYYQLISFFDERFQNITYVSENGALIMENGKDIFHSEIPRVHLQRIVARLQQDPRVTICLCGQKSAYLLSDDQEAWDQYKDYYYRLKTIRSLQDVDAQDIILKVALSVPDADTQEILEGLTADLQDIIKPVSSGHGSIDLIIPQYHKGHAIEFLCQRYHLSLQECAAFGDGGNDIEMLKMVGYGFAMGNASLAVKAAAQEVIEDHRQYGVFKTLLKCFPDIVIDERDKALLGMWYDANYDPQILQHKQDIHHLCYLYNHSDPLTVSYRQELLEKIFQQKCENLEIVAPFLCDCGHLISLGKDVYVNSHAYFMDGATITIGNHVFIGPSVGLYTAIHPLDYPSRDRGLEKAKPIVIEDHVWLGANVIVLPGVTIGKGSVIGAGSVVTKDIPPHVLAFGNPCQVKKTIQQD